jgi:hypothetical protein
MAGVALLVGLVSWPALGADPVVNYHKEIPSALKEAKNLHIPAFVILTKPKAATPFVPDPRIVRSLHAFASTIAPLSPAVMKQYSFEADTQMAVLDAEGKIVEKFTGEEPAENVVRALAKHVEEARAEILKSLKTDPDAKARKTALSGLIKLGPNAEDIIPFLTDAEMTIKESARKALSAVPPDAAMTPLLEALKSEDAAIRTAVHPFAVQATGYKAAPLKIWKSGTPEERAAAWDKWNDMVQTQFPPLNRAVVAFAEFSLGAQVGNGECSILAEEAFKSCNAKPIVFSGDTYLWGRALKSGEIAMPGDVVQFEKTKFSNGGSCPHHTAVIRKVYALGKYETLEQNVNGSKKVQVGKLDMSALKEGTVVIFRPQPK